MTYQLESGLIIPGKPSEERYSNPDIPKPHQANWLPGVAAQLTDHGIPTKVLVMPEPYAPDYDQWKWELNRHPLGPESTVIGHSAGAGFMLRVMSENPDLHIARLILVGLWHDREHRCGKTFFDYDFDPDFISRVGRTSLYHDSTDMDDAAARASVDWLLSSVHDPSAIIVHDMPGYGHFMLGNKMTSTDFPELVEEALRP